MSQDLQLFESPVFGTIEVLTLNGKEYFPATKVATILGYSNPQKAIRDHCLEDGCTIRSVIDSLGRPQNVKFIDEGNLYRLIVKSKLPQAQEFERWVFDEVLPMIRKTGGVYMADNLVDEFFRNPQGVVDIMQAYINEKKKVEELTPSANKWDNWISSKNIYTVHQASHILGIKGMGLINLFRYFRNNGFVSDKNLAFRQYQDQGLFRVKEIESVTRFGHKYKRFKTFLTPKGIDYFKERLINEGYTDLDFVGEPEGFISDYVKAA